VGMISVLRASHGAAALGRAALVIPVA